MVKTISRVNARKQELKENGRRGADVLIFPWVKLGEKLEDHY